MFSLRNWTFDRIRVQISSHCLPKCGRLSPVMVTKLKPSTLTLNVLNKKNVSIILDLISNKTHHERLMSSSVILFHLIFLLQIVLNFLYASFLYFKTKFEIHWTEDYRIVSIFVYISFNNDDVLLISDWNNNESSKILNKLESRSKIKHQRKLLRLEMLCVCNWLPTLFYEKYVRIFSDGSRTSRTMLEKILARVKCISCNK